MYSTTDTLMCCMNDNILSSLWDECKTLCRENTQTAFNSPYFSSIKITHDPFFVNWHLLYQSHCQTTDRLHLQSHPPDPHCSKTFNQRQRLGWHPIHCKLNHLQRILFSLFFSQTTVGFYIQKKKVLDAFHKSLVHLSLTFNLDFCIHVFGMVNFMWW